MANSSQTVAQTGADNGDPEKQTQNTPPFWALAAALVVSTLLLLVYGAWVKADVSPAAVFAVEMLVGTAALVSGALLGFLFGIPRTPPRSATAATAGTPTHAVYEPSNNLEQVSDWLTKVLVGATLVQLKELREFLSIIGLRVMQGVGGTATSAVTQLTLIVFGVVGFLGGFLWTRVYYGAIQVRADKDAFALLVEDLKNEVRNEVTNQVTDQVTTQVSDVKQQVEDTRKQSEVLASQSEQARAQAQEAATATTKLLQSQGTSEVAAAPSVAPVVLDPALEAKVAEFKSAPNVWESDPVEKIFGTGPSSKDGLTLTAAIDTVLDRESLILTLTVEGSVQRPLEGSVLFLLHPTYAQGTRTVVARNNRASLTVYSESWYHAAAIVGETVLVLNLKTIPGAPEWFTKD